MTDAPKIRNRHVAFLASFHNPGVASVLCDDVLSGAGLPPASAIIQCRLNLRSQPNAP